MRLILLIISLMVFSCSVIKIEKRKYNRGFFIQTKKLQQVSNGNEKQAFHIDTVNLDENSITECFIDAKLNKNKSIIEDEQAYLNLDMVLLGESKIYCQEKQKQVENKVLFQKFEKENSLNEGIEPKQNRFVSAKGIVRFILSSILYIIAIFFISLFSFAIYGIVNFTSGSGEGLFYLVEGILLPFLNVIFFLLLYRALYSEKYQGKKKLSDKKEIWSARLRKYLVISHILLIDFILVIFALNFF